MTPKPQPQRWLEDPGQGRIAKLLLPLLEDPAPGTRERVWARLDERGRSKPATRLILALCLTAAAVFLVLVINAPTSQGPVGAEIVFTEGGVEAQTGGSPFAPARPGDRLSDGARVRTKTGRGLVRLGDSGGVLLDPSSEVRLVEIDRKPGLHLSKGAVLVTVIHSPGRSPFIVNAGPHEIRVTGTTFRVERLRPDSCGVYVWDGAVEVRGPRETVRLNPFESHASTGPEPRAVSRAERDLLRRFLGASAVPEPAESPKIEPEEPAITEPPATEPDKREPSEQVTDGGTRSRRKVSRPALRKKPEKKPAPDAERRAYRLAASTEDPEQAIRLFDDIAKAGGPRAEIASYQASRLSMGLRVKDAVKRFERHLVRYPEGSFDAEARISLIECRMKLGHMESALKDIRSFLSKNPRTERLAELRFLRAEIHRQKDRNCAAALPDYEAALSSRTRREDALFFKAWCLYDVGNQKAAQEALNLYLQDYPTGRHSAAARRGFK